MQFILGMGLGRIFTAQGQFGPISFGPAQGLGRFQTLTFGPGLGPDFLGLGWIGPWAIQLIKKEPIWATFGPLFW